MGGTREKGEGNLSNSSKGRRKNISVVLAEEEIRQSLRGKESERPLQKRGGGRDDIK